MGWQIECVENSIILPKEGFKRLASTLTMLEEFEHSNASSNLKNYEIHFDNDDMEHMDWLSRIDIQEVMKEYKAKGRALFGSLEGDNNGEFWGYDFDGKGGMKKLKGEIIWND